MLTNVQGKIDGVKQHRTSAKRCDGQRQQGKAMPNVAIYCLHTKGDAGSPRLMTGNGCAYDTKNAGTA